MPEQPKIYHIIHVDKLASVILTGGLLCDAEIVTQHNVVGTNIGMNHIKQRRLTEIKLTSHPDLYVGQCVPFYFCPRSIMLYLIYQANHPELIYQGGQDPILHLQIDLITAVNWANQQQRRWAFTLSNAGSRFFEDRSNLAQLHELDWDAIQTTQWQKYQEGKQAEFLVEQDFPWQLIEAIGVYNHSIEQQVTEILQATSHRPPVIVKSNWYY